MPPVKYADVHRTLDRLAEKFDVKCPIPYMLRSSVPILFTVGSARKCEIVMSPRILDLLDSEELEALFAREMARVSEGSVPQNTFAALVAGIIASFSTIILWMSLLSGFGQENDPAPKFIRFLAMGIVMLPAALVVYLGSADMTLRSDMMAAKTLGNKKILISALKRAQTDMNLNCVEYFNPGHVHLFAINPVKVNSFMDVHLSLFNMKPDLSHRLRAIEGTGIN